MEDTKPTPLTVDQVYPSGTPVRILYVDSVGSTCFFDTTVEQCDERLALGAPDASGSIRLRMGQSVKVIRAIGRDAYVATTNISGAQRAPRPLIFLDRPADQSIEKEPRRRFFRVNVSMPFRSRLGEGSIVNASATGFLLETTDDLYRDGLEFMLGFDIPGGRSDAQARVKVMRRYHENGMFYTGVHITSIRPGVQDELIRYLLTRQRQLPR